MFFPPGTPGVIKRKEDKALVNAYITCVCLSVCRPSVDRTAFCSRGQLKCDGTRAETRFRLSRESDESI